MRQPPNEKPPGAGGANGGGASLHCTREEVISATRLLVASGGIVELRVLDGTMKGGRQWPGTVSGYFDSPAKLADACATIASAKGCYITLNEINPALLARSCNRIRITGKGDATTADHDVVRRRWLPIDLDPVRPAGISATDDEHEYALGMARIVRETMRKRGWPEPILEDTGNGALLLYRIDLPTDDGGLVERVLAQLAADFDDERVKVDTTMSNPARIVRLVGTPNRKGDSTDERPHRMARLVDVPEQVQVVPEALLVEYGGPAEQAKPATKGSASQRGGDFDVAAWIAQHLPDAEGPKPWKGGGRMWTLPTCPWNPEHTGGCAFIGQRGDGPIVAGCQHNSCSWKWADLRERFEPASTRKGKSTDNAGGEDEKRGPAQSEMLVRLALEQYRFGRTEADEPFAVENDGPAIARMFRGSSDALRAQLAKAYRQAEGRTPSATALADALMVLHGHAADADAEPVHLRLAEHAGGIIIDRGTADGSAIELKPGAWRPIDRSPVLFRRTALTSALPEPVRGESIDALRAMMNVSPATWPLVLGWLTAALMPDIPHPILLLGGLQGAGKSTAARMLVGLIDPSPALLRSEPRDAEAWAMTCGGSWLVPIDNVSTIPAWWSDALCKAVTGDGWVRRRLYSDSDLSVLAYRRVVLLTSIDAGAMRGDLGDRLVLVDLEPIDARRRRTEAELNRAYHERRGALLGALLDVLAAVLEKLPALDVREYPRMADFARVLAAMDAAGITDGALPTYLNQHERIAADVVESDAVATALVRLVDERNLWQGTAGELLDTVKPERPGKAWPANGRGMAGRLKRLTPALASVGIRVEYLGPTGRDKARLWQLEKLPAQLSASSASSANAADAAANDDTDADGLADGCGNRPQYRPHLNGDGMGMADRADGADGSPADASAEESSWTF